VPSVILESTLDRCITFQLMSSPFIEQFSVFYSAVWCCLPVSAVVKILFCVTILASLILIHRSVVANFGNCLLVVGVRVIPWLHDWSLCNCTCR